MIEAIPMMARIPVITPRETSIYFPSAMSEAHFGADKTQDRARSIFQKMVIARTDGIGGGVVFHSEELHALGQFASDLLGSYLFWR